MNNEISSKSSLSLSSVDATLVAIIPDTPIVSIAGSTLSEITTTTTSTTTTPTPTPTSYETNKADISSSSSVIGTSIPSSMSGAPAKNVGNGDANNRATAVSAAPTPPTSTPKILKDNIKITKENIVDATSDTLSTTSANIDIPNSNHKNPIDSTSSSSSTKTTSTSNFIDAVIAGAANTGATSKSPTIIVASSTCNTAKLETTNTTDKKSKDPELWEEEKFTNLDDQNLKLLLEEAYSYRSPTDKENKSELFLSLLEKAENEKEDITLCRMPTSSRLKRNHHQQHQHHRQKHGGSLQDLDEAVRNESILDPEYFFGTSCGQRNRRINHNSRQKKYSSVSSRQREGGSLPNNVNFTNCARLFGVGANCSGGGGGGGGGGGTSSTNSGGVGGGGGITGGEVASFAAIDQQFPFTNELNTLVTSTTSGTSVVITAAAAAAVAATANNNNNGSSINNSNNNHNSGNNGSVNSNSSNNTKLQRRNAATRTNTMSLKSSLSSTLPGTGAAASTTTKFENDQLIGQPIGVLIGGQVITQKPTGSITSNGNNVNNDKENGNIVNTAGCRSLKDAICSVNVGDCVIEMGETILDVQQQQQILQSKSQEGRVYYDRLENVELMPRANMNAVPSRTCFGSNTANAYVDDKVHFTALRSFNSNVAAASGGTKTNQTGVVDTKYLPLGDDYKAYKSVLAIADKEEMREVDENGNAVTEAFTVNSTTHAATATVYNPINVGSGQTIATASTASTGAGIPPASKSKSKKQPKQERNVTTVNVETVAGYRGTDPVEKLVEYIESTTGDDNKIKQKKERKKQDKQDKHNKIKKSNSLEELRSCSKMEVDDLKCTAATTESNVMMRNKAKGAKNNSSSAADINKNFDSGACGSMAAAVSLKEKQTNNNAGGNVPVGTTNRKSERRSWGIEELEYLGDTTGGNSNRSNGNGGNITGISNNTVIVACQSTVDEKSKDKERKSKNREEKDKNRFEKTEKPNVDGNSALNSTQTAVAISGNTKLNCDKNEKQQQQQQQQHNQTMEKFDKTEKRKKNDQQQTANSHQSKSVNVEPSPTAVVDILAMESIQPETAEFHVVTKKKKTKKQRLSMEESNGNGNGTNTNNNNKTHNFIGTAENIKATANQKQQQQIRFNAKYSSNEHSNPNSNNGNNANNSNHYQQQHYNNNHYHNQIQQQQQQQHQQQPQQQQQHQHQHQYQNQHNNDKSRRKSTSSVPPSEKSDSSDLDSVHSLPIERGTKLANNSTSTKANSSKTSNKSTRQNKNTAGSVATVSLPQKPQQVQQMPTPFSYAEIAKEAKTLTATVSSMPGIAQSAATNNNNNSAGPEHTSHTRNVVADHSNPTHQHPPPPPSTQTTDEVRNTPLRGQQLAAGTTNNSSSATTLCMTSSTINSTPTPPTTTTTLASNAHLTTQNCNQNVAKSNKTKKSAAKTDFPALGSASEVGVAASAARADIFAKAVLNSSQQIGTTQYQHQNNSNTRDICDNATSTMNVSIPKSTAASHIDMPKDANNQPTTLQSQTQTNQNPMQQQQQHQYQHNQQAMQKPKSIDNDTNSVNGGGGGSGGNNVSYSNTMDHQQYPALKTVKRHIASNVTTLTPIGNTSVVASTAAGHTTHHHQQQQQQHNAANNSTTAQINFAAAARQVTPSTSASNHSNNDLSTSLAVSETTTSYLTTSNTTNSTVLKKNSGANKDKTLLATSVINNTAPNSSIEQNPKKTKKEKNIQQIGEHQTSKTLLATAASGSSSRKSSAATQTSTTAQHGHKENNGKQNPAKSARSASPSNTTTTMSSSGSVTGGVMPMPQTVANQQTAPSTTRPAVIILNDDTAGISTDFTFGDFNEDELHFFDDDAEEFGSTGFVALSAVRSDVLNEDHSMAKLTSSSPRSRSTSTASLQQLNDSGASSDRCTGDVVVSNSDVTLSPNNPKLVAKESQHSSSAIHVSSGRTSNRSGGSAASGGSAQSNQSGDSGIYTSASKMQENSTANVSNVNTFMQQHLSTAETNATMTNESESSNAETTETNSTGSFQEQPRQQQQLETCNEIESAIIAAARRAANQQQQQQQQLQQQQQQYPQKKGANNQSLPTTNANYQHSNSNSSSFSSSSSVDGGVNRYYTAVQSPPSPSNSQPPQQRPTYYNSNNRQAYSAYPVHHSHPQQPQQQQQQQQHMQQQLCDQNSYTLATSSQAQPLMANTIEAPLPNVYSRSNSDCEEDYVSPPPPGTFVVKIENKEYDLHYLPPNISTNGGSQNEFIVDYVSSVWDEVINSKYTKVYDGQ